MSTSTTPLNFAPYSEPPDQQRPALASFSTPSPAAVQETASSYHDGAPVNSLASNTAFSSSATYGNTGYAPIGSAAAGLDSGYETTTLRHDWAGPLCYLLGPLGAAFFLVFEVENDWVRFHAWQSVLLSAFLVLVHLFFFALFWRWMQYLIFLVDGAFALLMAMRAFRDSDHLERHRLPLIGDLADEFVKSE
ncbi:hypothetical protein JCM10207_007674 [Rhodosporidiobolus poonsookiae]